MPTTKPPLLLDNCAISACYDCGGWKALVARYDLQTVEEVEQEATTGYQHRKIIDPQEFRRDVVVHPVEELERIEAKTQFEGLYALDDGESDLWVHALTRNDAWILCGPDIASIKFGIERGFRDKLISLEELLTAVGFKAKSPLKEQYTKKWLENLKSEISLEIELGKLKKKK